MKRWFFFLFFFIFLISGCTINIENSSPNVKREVIQLEEKPKNETKVEAETKPKENTETPTPSTPPTTLPKTDNHTGNQNTQQTPSYSSVMKYNVFSGSYTNPTGAFSKVNTLKNHQIPSAVVEAYVHGRKWYRVYVGSFDDEASAQRYLNALIQKGFTDTFMIYETPPTTQVSPAVTPSSPPVQTQQEEPAQTEKAYNIYSGSFENYTNAQARVDLLKTKQISSVIVEAYVHGRKWYRVYVGTFHDKALAEQYVNHFKNLGFTDTFMVYERDLSM